MSTEIWLFIIIGAFLFCLGVVIGLAGHRHELKLQAQIQRDLLIRRAHAQYQHLRREHNDLISELTLAHLMVDERDLTISAMTQAHMYLWSKSNGAGDPHELVSDRELTAAGTATIMRLVNESC